MIKSVNGVAFSAQNTEKRPAASGVGFSAKPNTEDKPKLNKPLLAALICATPLSVLGALTLLSRGKLGTGKVANFLKNAKVGSETLSLAEGFNMFKPKTYGALVKTIKYGPLDVITMAGASVAGGLAVGCALDKKENRKIKLKESISQMVGNIIFPIVCLTAGAILADKAVGKTWFNRMITHQNVKPLKIAASIGAFILGVIGGNKVANKLNAHVFKTGPSSGHVPARAVKPADFAAHIDDGCATVGLAGKGVAICEKIVRVVPAALTVAGIATGLAKDEKK